MATFHAENYLTTYWHRPSAVVAAELVDLISSPDNGDRQSKSKLLQIEQTLATANELFLARRYQAAIESYKQAQGLIYQQINPAFPARIGGRRDLVYDLHPEFFEPLMHVALEFIEALDPHPPVEVNYSSPFVRVPPELGKAIEQYGNMGVTSADGLPTAVRIQSQVAAQYADRGEWTRAQAHYEQALRQLNGQDSEAAVAASAALNLNLGGILVQMDQVDRADALFEKADNGFRRTKDIVGMAQVRVNRAALMARQGDHDAANALLQEAQNFLDEAEGAPRRPNTTTPAVTPVRIPNLLSNLSIVNLTRPDLAANIVRLNTLALTTRAGSTKPGTLSPVTTERGLAITSRLPGKGLGWDYQPAESRVEAREKAIVKALQTDIGGKTMRFEWKAGDQLPVAEIADSIYAKRVDFIEATQLTWVADLFPDKALQLPHLYLYVIPVALGDCYNVLGEFQTAQSYYLHAADYQFINTALEVPALWTKLAQNVLEWGDRHYRNDEFPEALEVYRTVLEPPGGGSLVFAGSPLYSHTKLKLTGDKIITMLTNDLTNANELVSPALASIVLEIRARLIQLNAGLDFLGMPATIVPIWSFEFLQNVARYFAQQAIQAEHEFISWWDRAENEALTEQQLEQAVTQAGAERELARQQREAAQAEAVAYEEGRDLANLRRQNTQQNRNDYAAMSWERIWLSSANAWYSSQNPWELEHAIPGDGRHIHEVIADNTERLQSITRDYELAAMDRQRAEMQQAEVVAQAQLNAASARIEAAQQMEVVAQLRAQAAQQNLNAFSNQFFTPGVWYQMGAFMRSISASYRHKAIRVARLMQRAYNFENDLNRHFIKTDYSTNTVKGLLAGDALLLDIDSFTYDLITTVQRKDVPIKHTVSLAERYPFLFETGFRNTGRIEFELRLDDLDKVYPGTYARRLETVELEVEGVLPAGGVHGTLTNAGISRYRTEDINNLKVRIQPKETIVLSEYRVRNDALIFPADPRQLKLFEGAGVESTWVVELPRFSNDLDYRAISDIRLTFYCKAKYDRNLEAAVRAQLAALPGSQQAGRLIPLRWTFPDAFFHFQDTGRLVFSLTPLDFPYNIVDPQIRQVGIVMVTDPGVNPTGWQVRLQVPAAPDTLIAPATAEGTVIADNGHPWEPLQTGKVIGDYIVELRADENPGLVVNGRIQLGTIQNVVLILEYDYTPRA